MKIEPLTQAALVAPKPESAIAMGRRGFATKLCRQGKYEESKAYCIKHGIEYPPFAPKGLERISARPATSEADQKPAVGNGAAGEPPTGQQTAVPLETPPQAQISETTPVITPPIQPVSPTGERKAEIYGFCRNPRFIRVQFIDNGEIGTMYKIRKNYRTHDIVTAVLVEGGANPLYEEVWRPT